MCGGGASGVGPHGIGMSVPMTLIEDAERSFPWGSGCTARTQTGVPLLLAPCIATGQGHLAIFQPHIHDFRSSTKLGAFTIAPPPPPRSARTHACTHGDFCQTYLDSAVGAHCNHQTRWVMPNTCILEEVGAEDDVHIWPSELQLVFSSTGCDILDEVCDGPPHNRNKYNTWTLQGMHNRIVRAE